MFFRKRDKRVGPPLSSQSGSHAGRADLYPIEFDMMLKGAIIKRRGGQVRQLGVTVNGSTRLVTSGDVVDRDTFEALLAAGAIRVTRPDFKGSIEPAPKRFVDATGDAPEE